MLRCKVLMPLRGSGNPSQAFLSRHDVSCYRLVIRHYPVTVVPAGGSGLTGNSDSAESTIAASLA